MSTNMIFLFWVVLLACCVLKSTEAYSYYDDYYDYNGGGNVAQDEMMPIFSCSQAEEIFQCYSTCWSAESPASTTYCKCSQKRKACLGDSKCVADLLKHASNEEHDELIACFHNHRQSCHAIRSHMTSRLISAETSLIGNHLKYCIW